VGLTTLELAFETKPLREICESEHKAKQELGAKVAEELKRRLADLRAAASVEDLPVAKPRKISGTCIFDLAEGYRLVVAPNHTKNPLLKSGTVNCVRRQHS
jgi:ribosomal protein L29